MRADFARFEPGLAVAAINGFALRAGDLYLDDLRLGPAGDEAFRFASRLDGTKVDSEWDVPIKVASVYDSLRRSNVIEVTEEYTVTHGKNYLGGGATGFDYNVSGMRTMSLWGKPLGAASVTVTVQTSVGLRGLKYTCAGSDSATPSSVVGNLATFGSSLTSGAWRRVERNLAQDVAAAWPGETLLRVRGATLTAGVDRFCVDDVRFSNGMTVEHNVLGPDVIE